jgi:hypothetical protein
MSNKGLLRFCWQEQNGEITNWWSDDLAKQKHRFVHTEWGKFAVAVDVKLGEVQLQIANPPSRRIVRVVDLPRVDGNDFQMAFEAVAMTGTHAAFAVELFLRAIDRDDLASCLTPDGRPEGYDPGGRLP